MNREGSFIPEEYNEDYMEALRHPTQQLLSVLESVLKASSARTVLDVGCGPGWLIRYLRERGFDVRGCDISEDAARLSGQVVASATALPFADGEFDAVVALSLIEHLNEREGVLFADEMNRVLKNEGIAFLVTPNFAAPMRYVQGRKWFAYADPTHVNFYTFRSLKRLLLSHGFSDVRYRFKRPQCDLSEWELPDAIKRSPSAVQNLVTYSLVSSPLARLRDSISVSAKKSIRA